MNLFPDQIFYHQAQKATKALKKVIDPELFVNIIDLGLVYDIDFSDPDIINVHMTLSTAHCPLGEAITNGVERALLNEFPERKVIVSLVWEPAWSFERITETGKRALGISAC